jgi:hypothetical protein
MINTNFQLKLLEQINAIITALGGTPVTANVNGTIYDFLDYALPIIEQLAESSGGGGANYAYPQELSTDEAEQPVTFNVGLVTPAEPQIAVGNLFTEADGNTFVVKTLNGASSTASYKAPDLTGAVRYDKEQALTDGQKTQARDNIGSGTKPVYATGDNNWTD